MKILNKFIWSKKEPLNKNDIWFDGSTWRMYTEEAWQSFTLPVDAADKVAKVIENASEVYQEKLNAGYGIIIEGNTISLDMSSIDINTTYNIGSIQLFDDIISSQNTYYLTTEDIEAIKGGKLITTTYGDITIPAFGVSGSGTIIHMYFYVESKLYNIGIVDDGVTPCIFPYFCNETDILLYRDDFLSEISENSVQNKVITAELNKKLNKTDVATINGQSLTGGGNIVIPTYDDGEIKQQITELSEEHNDLNYEVTAIPHVMIGKYSSTTAGNLLSFFDYAPRSSTQPIARYSDKFDIVGVESVYDIIFLDQDNIVTRRNGYARSFNSGEVAMIVIFINENNPNGYSQLRVLQGVTLTEKLEVVYKDIDISSVMSGNSIQDVILDGYYDPSGNFVPNSTYKALPLLPNFNDSLFIDMHKWKVVSLGVRCLDSEKKYIGDAVRNEYDAKIRFDALANTAYYGVYWNPTDAAEDYSKHFILGLEYPQLYNLLTKENGGEENGGEEIDAEKLSLIDYIPSVNMYNPNDVDALVGAYISDGNILNSATYDSSGYIAVKENTTYYNAADSARSYRFVNFYDSSKKFLSQVQDDTGLNLNSFTTPTGCAYIRVTVYANYERTHFVANISANYTPYSPQLGTDGKKVATIDEVGNTLYGKKWCVVGDSFSADFPKGYADDWYYENGTSKVYGRQLVAERLQHRPMVVLPIHSALTYTRI